MLRKFQIKDNMSLWILLLIVVSAFAESSANSNRESIEHGGYIQETQIRGDKSTGRADIFHRRRSNADAQRRREAEMSRLKDAEVPKRRDTVIQRRKGAEARRRIRIEAQNIIQNQMKEKSPIDFFQNYTAKDHACNLKMWECHLEIQNTLKEMVGMDERVKSRKLQQVGLDGVCRVIQRGNRCYKKALRHSDCTNFERKSNSNALAKIELGDYVCKNNRTEVSRHWNCLVSYEVSQTGSKQCMLRMLQLKPDYCDFEPMAQCMSDAVARNDACRAGAERVAYQIARRLETITHFC